VFGFFFSTERKMRDNAGNWLQLADKILHYRRDQLTGAQTQELRQKTADLQLKLKQRADAGKLKLGIESLEGLLQQVGGTFYPKSAMVENVEFFLAAAIIVLGIRTYFVQPFKIPTNSMWPSYYGMTPQVFKQRAAEPGALAMGARLLAFGARPHRLDAPADGEVLIPVGGAESRGAVHSDIVNGQSWLVIPTKVREYTLLVGEEPVKVRVPLDFDFDWLVSEAFFSRGEGYSPEGFHAELRRRVNTGEFEVHVVDGETLRCIRTGRRVRAGDRVLSFDVLTGDQLFVDRFSYHFVRPPVGSGFVFRTGNIPGIADTYGDQYYVKRLVGAPGDTLEIRNYRLYRNGGPITGAAAFEKNALRQGDYVGYRNIGELAAGKTMTVPSRSFLALGDNSANSADGRYWGYVPEKDVIGRPLFIYYPFSGRWGPVR
jgi:signal peptidase I